MIPEIEDIQLTQEDKELRAIFWRCYMGGVAIICSAAVFGVLV